MITYSIVIPVYNSAAILQNLNERLHTTMQNLKVSFEILYIDDNSNDTSWNELTNINRRHKQTVKIIRLANNYGQHSATFCGLKHVKGEYVITLDDDLQHPPEEIPKLINAISSEKMDVVYGVPESKNYKPKLRKWAGSFWDFSTRNFHDAYGHGSSFRIISPKIVSKIALHNHHFIYIDEIFNWYTNNISSVAVKFQKSLREKSGYSFFKLLQLAARFTVFYSLLPIKIMTLGGVLIGFFSFIIGLYYILKKIIVGTIVPGYTSIIVSIFFSTGIIMICLGVIGQYLGNIHTVLNHKPTYVIRESKL